MDKCVCVCVCVRVRVRVRVCGAFILHACSYASGLMPRVPFAFAHACAV